MYSALLVASYIIMRCNKTQMTISNLKLQKILYFIQAEFLVTVGYPCFSERIEAWDFGPVVPDVYHKYKVYGSASIPYVDRTILYSFTDKDKNLIDDVIDECAKYSASKLVEITHNQDPWKNAYHSRYRTTISNDSIKSFFEEV